MAETILPMLSPMHAGNRVPPLSLRGSWQSLGSADPLQVLASGLNAGESLHGTSGDIVSVPDVWAQLTVFHNALMVETHPLHQRSVSEWRGLLACFALAAYRAPGLTSEIVRLSSLSPGRWSDLVTRLPPQAPMLGGAVIDEVALVRIDERLMGIAQPLTLVAPSRSLRDHLGERPPVPWMEDGRLMDPVTRSGLSREERAVLVRFTETLCRDLESAQNGEDDPVVLLGLARDFLRDSRSGQQVAGMQFEAEPARLALPSLPVFGALRRRERAGLPGGGISDCTLQLRSGLVGGLRGIVLADPALDERLGRPSGDIRVWGHVSLRMLQERPEQLEQVRVEAQAAGFLVVRPEELFLPTLFGASGVEGEQGFELHPLGARNHLLPLSPLVLAMMDRASLARACRIAGGGAGGTTVDLQVHLADGATVTLSRHYPVEETLEPPFALSVWPDFQAPWWGLHIGYSGATPDIQFVTGGIVSLEGIGRTFAAADGFSAVAAGRALLRGNVAGLADATWLRQDRQNVRALFWLPGSAEAAVLEYRRGSAPRPAGLLLLPDPAPVTARPGLTAIIGIDFGTTNTAA